MNLVVVFTPMKGISLTDKKEMIKNNNNKKPNQQLCFTTAMT